MSDIQSRMYHVLHSVLMSDIQSRMYHVLHSVLMSDIQSRMYRFTFRLERRIYPVFRISLTTHGSRCTTVYSHLDISQLDYHVLISILTPGAWCTMLLFLFVCFFKKRKEKNWGGGGGGVPLGYGLSCVTFLLPVFEQSDKFKSVLGLVWLVCARGRRSCVCVCVSTRAHSWIGLCLKWINLTTIYHRSEEEYSFVNDQFLHTHWNLIPFTTWQTEQVL